MKARLVYILLAIALTACSGDPVLPIDINALASRTAAHIASQPTAMPTTLPTATPTATTLPPPSPLPQQVAAAPTITTATLTPPPTTTPAGVASPTPTPTVDLTNLPPSDGPAIAAVNIEPMMFFTNTQPDCSPTTTTIIAEINDTIPLQEVMIISRIQGQTYYMYMDRVDERLWATTLGPMTQALTISTTIYAANVRSQVAYSEQYDIIALPCGELTPTPIAPQPTLIPTSPLPQEEHQQPPPSTPVPAAAVQPPTSTPLPPSPPPAATPKPAPPSGASPVVTVLHAEW